MVCYPGGTFQALRCERVVLGGVTPTPTLRQRLRGNTALAQICIFSSSMRRAMERRWTLLERLLPHLFPLADFKLQQTPFIIQLG